MEALLNIETIRALHDEIILPGNIAGERDGRLEGVHGRIESRVYYLEVNDVFDVAAITGTYIAMGRAFVDGNRRTAFACIDVILAAAGAPLSYSLPADEDPLFSMIIQCAQGLRDESHLASHLRERYIKSAGLTMPGDDSE